MPCTAPIKLCAHCSLVARLAIGAAAAAHQVDYRVRGFGGVATFPVVYACDDAARCACGAACGETEKCLHRALNHALNSKNRFAGGASPPRTPPARASGARLSQFLLISSASLQVLYLILESLQLFGFGVAWVARAG